MFNESAFLPHKGNQEDELKIVILDSAMKKLSADKRRLIARPCELHGQLAAVNLAAIGDVRCVACNARTLI